MGSCAKHRGDGIVHHRSITESDNCNWALLRTRTTYIQKLNTFPDFPSVVRGWGYDRPPTPNSVPSVVGALCSMLSPRRGVDHRPAATILTQVAVIAIFVSMSACMPGKNNTFNMKSCMFCRHLLKLMWMMSYAVNLKHICRCYHVPYRPTPTHENKTVFWP